MHYAAIAAVHFIPAPGVEGSLVHAISVSSLGLASLTAATVAILGVAITTSMIDRRLTVQAQQAAESQNQVQTIFDNLAEGVVLMDRERNVIKINRAARQLLGITTPALSGTELNNAFELFLPGGQPLDHTFWPGPSALRGEFFQNREIQITRKDTGRTVTVEVNTAPIVNQAGETVQVILTCRDVTERRLIDESRIRLAEMVESSHDAIIGSDNRGRVTSWNSGASKIFGYTASEMIGLPIGRLLPSSHQDEEDEILRRIRQSHTVEHFETVRKRKDDHLIHVSLTISPIRNARGEVIGASTIARDITEKKQMELQLHQGEKMEAIGQLTGGIAHDFNNLLGVVVGNLDLLERLVQNSEPARNRVQIALRAAIRGADLTRRLLAFSSRQEIRPALTRLEEPIQNTLTLADRALGPEIRITTDFAPSLPPVLVDASRLESALLNLVINARDAMPRGGRLTLSTRPCNLDESDPSVQTGDLKPGVHACIAILDTGEGMSKETLERAFEPFFTTKDRGKGTGLGLATVYGFVKQSRGVVRIDSEPGLGTTVSIYLPLSEMEAEPAPFTLSSVPVAKLGGTVLLVDDELALLDIGMTYLQGMGLTPLQANDGASAVDILRARSDIDLLITDIVMPGGINGVELARIARQLLPKIKIIYTSGYPADALAQRSGTRVDAPLLNKPYQRSQFVHVVHAAIA